MAGSDPALGGLHHVTAITGRADANLAFYTGVLGLRLVKKTVNQDDVSAYHLFYGDELGGPGTEVTFFHWPQAGANRPGTGTVSALALSVPDRAALAWWGERLEAQGVAHGACTERRGHGVLPFTDPEGQRLELVEAAGAPGPGGRPWARSPVPPAMAIRGLHGVTLTLAAAAPTVARLAGLLGFRRVETRTEADGTALTVLECGPGGPGSEVRLAVPPSLRRGQPGIGGVHHVALRTPDGAAQREWERRLGAAGVPNSSIVDRYYFQSLYFREPGGVLLEIATDGPGFATDEPADRLGEQLALPPFLEPRRAEIEAGLPPLGAGEPPASGPR